MDILRPTSWDEYIGQERLKTELQIRIDSAIHDDRPMDHTLLCAPPGAGKTSLAEMVADRLGEPFEVITMPAGKHLFRMVSEFAGVLLLDEIHRASVAEQELLLNLLEFGYLQDTSGRRIQANWLTVIGATTERQKLIQPLIDRFPIRPDYDEYTTDEMTRIVLGMAVKADVDIPEDVAEAFGKAATGTPRKAGQFVLGYRDLWNAMKGQREPTVEEVFHLCRTETDGLTGRHMKYLETLNILGGTKGLPVLCALLKESPSELMELETLLVKQGLLTYSERGRELTQAGMARVRGTDPVPRSPRRPRETV